MHAECTNNVCFIAFPHAADFGQQAYECWNCIGCTSSCSNSEVARHRGAILVAIAWSKSRHRMQGCQEVAKHCQQPEVHAHTL